MAFDSNWRNGFGVALAVHAGVALVMMTHLRVAERIQAPPAFSIELAASPSSTSPNVSTTPPVPVEAAPPPVPKASVALSRSTDAVVAQDKKAATPSRDEAYEIKQADAAHPLTPTAPPAMPPAPMSSHQGAISTKAVSDPDAKARNSWEAEVLARLEAAKRYPATARFGGEEGVAYVNFTVSSAGEVLSVRILRSTGYSDLDREVAALLHRVRLPPPPPAIQGSGLEFTVPISFTINKGSNG
ncbi:protein TonB [Rhizomicrobium palustre]|uniref:Protein TonB n=1 Tax=Rhizomicrobium palustre TaxID=189966 RepID=A0A846MZ49_9PROT|nr:energy transducer TonB [Rhizomicrobium palustre]NIK88505.1 protein TonB [Rhizomicrobium palustre]